ncbi:hypothetical protein Aperf_G00000002251 [Anoplocephala perfoliata]
MSGVSVLRFLLACGKIKRTVRTGWTRYGVDKPESVADHMYRMALLSTLLPSTEAFKPEKVMKMAIVHDLAECVVGDITPFCGVSKEEKYRREKEALTAICSNLPDEIGCELVNLWKEFEERTTPESVVCNDLDKFEMILQAYEYEVEAGRPGWLDEFFSSTEGIFKFPCVREWVDALRKERSEFMAKK